MFHLAFTMLKKKNAEGGGQSKEVGVGGLQRLGREANVETTFM